MLKKLTIIAVLIFTVFISFPVSAQTDNTSNIPETNPFCWHLKDCQRQRQQFGGSGVGKEGFITGASVAPCTGGTGDEEWGRCLPAGTSKTEISFGGKSEFSNIGDFIILIYKYLLTIVSIVAAVMIVVAGIQWITSSGNSEAIGSAKKRIAGALIGLFIGYMSYFVLNSINPALVNLRLPQVWLVKPISLTPEFCSQLEPSSSTSKIKFMYAADANNQTAPVTLETAAGKADGFKWKYYTDKSGFTCGQRFFGEAAGKTPCMGDRCLAAPGQNCFDNKGDRKNYTCGNVRIGGKVSYTPGLITYFWEFLGGAITNDWKKDPVVGTWIKVVCKQGDVPSDFVSGRMGATDYYLAEATNEQIENMVKKCDNSGGLNGFALALEFARLGTNEYHYFGKNGEDLGYEHETYNTGVSGKAPAHFFDDNAHKINGAKHLFSKEELIKGKILPINANDVLNISDVMNRDNMDKILNKYKEYWSTQ